MTHIFVAGSTGQVALSLEEEAQKRGLPLSTHGRPGFDLTNLQGLENTLSICGATALVNAAAYTAVDAAEDDKDTAGAINKDGAAALAAAAAKLDIPFIHLSTDYVFSGEKETAYTEEDQTGPTGAYGRSKLAGEHAVRQANPKAIILRTAWVYSPFGKNFLKTMVKLAETRDELGIVADQIGNPTYAPDIAKAILDILTVIEKTGWQSSYAGVFHLAGTGSTTWHGFANAIFDAAAEHGHPRPTAKALTTAEYPTPAKRPANSQLDCTKLYSTFGIRLPEWQESTKTCVKRLSENGTLG